MGKHAEKERELRIIRKRIRTRSWNSNTKGNQLSRKKEGRHYSRARSKKGGETPWVLLLLWKFWDFSWFWFSWCSSWSFSSSWFSKILVQNYFGIGEFLKNIFGTLYLKPDPLLSFKRKRSVLETLNGSVFDLTVLLQPDCNDKRFAWRGSGNGLKRNRNRFKTYKSIFK